MSKYFTNFCLWASKNLVGPGHPRPSARHFWVGPTYGILGITF